jgi:hypothetical protein
LDCRPSGRAWSRCPAVPLSRCPAVPLARCPAGPLARGPAGPRTRGPAGLLVARPRVLEDEIKARTATKVAASAHVIVPNTHEMTNSTEVITYSDGSCRAPVRAKPVWTGTVGATTGLTERMARRHPHGPRTRWNIGRHESPRPGGRR